MTDKPTEEDYRLQATMLYTQLREDRAAALKYQFDVGKWLIGSLFLLNGGALVAIAGKAPVQAGEHAASWFVGGIVSAMLCGLITWANAGLLVMIYDDWARPAMLVARDHWPSDQKGWRSKAITWTFAGSVLAGILSLGLFVEGALTVSATPSPAPRTQVAAGQHA